MVKTIHLLVILSYNPEGTFMLSNLNNNKIAKFYDMKSTKSIDNITRNAVHLLIQRIYLDLGLFTT